MFSIEKKFSYELYLIYKVNKLTSNMEEKNALPICFYVFLAKIVVRLAKTKEFCVVLLF